MIESNSLILGTQSNGVITGVTLNANLNSNPVWIDKVLRVSIQFTCTTSVNGTLQLQASNDLAVGLPPNQFVPTNWVNILGSAISVSTSGTYYVPAMTATPQGYLECCWEYLRLVFTDSSGGTSTGTGYARIVTKGF